MINDLWNKAKNSLRQAMLSPGFNNHDSGDQDYDDYYEEESPKAEKPWQEVASAATAPKVSPVRFGSKIVDINGRKGLSDKNIEIILATPKNADTTSNVINNIRAGKICSVNLADVDATQTQRIVDLISGAAYALHATLNRTGKHTFIIAPEGIDVTNEIKEAISSGGYMFPWASSK
jgi:cell division inhibitor SepF